MHNKYYLRNAITLNVNNKKYDAIAIKITAVEIRKHRHQFKYFDFTNSIKDGFAVYKICRADEEDIFQGMVAVKVSTGFLECGNMEISDLNKSPISMYNYVGKCIIGLCCKISEDEGFGGAIAFFAKNNMFGYYGRYGADLLFGLRMFLDEKAAKKLIDLYF